MIVSPRNNSHFSKKSYFERHPIVTIVTFLIFTFFAITFCIEKYFAYRHKISSHGGIERSIRLRENMPLQTDYSIPKEEYLKRTDGLARKKYLFRMDECGFVYPSKIYENPELCIVFFGGSTTECQYNDENVRFPYLAGRLIEQKTGKKCNAYNQGVSGNTTMHANDILLNKIIPMRPDFVILMENFNDMITLMYEGTYWNTNPSRSLIVVNAEKNANVMFSLFKDMKNLLIPNLYTELRQIVDFTEIKRKKMDEFGHLRGKKLMIDEKLLYTQFDGSVETFVGISRIWDIKPILMTQFNRFKARPDEIIKNQMKDAAYFGISYDDMMRYSEAFNEHIRDIGKRSNVLVIDLDSLVPKEKRYMYDIIHLNDSGSQLAAHIIADKISQMYVK